MAFAVPAVGQSLAQRYRTMRQQAKEATGPEAAQYANFNGEYRRLMVRLERRFRRGRCAAVRRQMGAPDEIAPRDSATWRRAAVGTAIPAEASTLLVYRWRGTDFLWFACANNRVVATGWDLMMMM